MGRSAKVSAASVPEQATRRGRTRGSFVYGIVPAGTAPPPDARGLGDPPGAVGLVERGEIAALVSDVNLERPLGGPGDILAYEGLLDAVAADGPVLPFRFGAVLPSLDAVTDELLAPHHDDYLAALEQLDGQAEFVVTGRYDERAVTTEILAESPAARNLWEQLESRPEDATRDERSRLGEIIAASVEAKRDMDTRLLLDGLTGHYRRACLREPAHEWDAVHVALLAGPGDGSGLERALTEFGERWFGRVDLRLLGPMAPYDFVVAEA
ncbi:GvpL/GvpF family gas vesicle protein [Nonomuraea sp. NPDC004297]